MRQLPAFARRGVCLLGLLPLLAANILAQPLGINIAWDPVTDADKQMKEPVVDKKAGAEALFWKVHLYDFIRGGEELERVLHHYVRIKVFNEAGREKASKIDIEFNETSSVMDIAGRTIKADGTIVELKKDAVHERDLTRVGRYKRKVKAFAMPAVEPGAIVEYRWKEVRRDTNIRYARLQMQREFPIHKITYFVKPFSKDDINLDMGIRHFLYKASPLKLENNGFTSMTVVNMPAFEEELYMPGEPNVRPWGLLFYHNGSKREPEKYWDEVGKDLYGELKRAVKVSNEVKEATDKALAEGADDKIVAIIRYIRKNIRLLSDVNVTDAERTAVYKQMPKDRWRTSAEVLKSGICSTDEMNNLFAAMATQAGLEARPALVSDRDELIFQPQLADRYFLRNIDMAVKVGDQWKIYDATTRLLPPNMVSWREEGMTRLSAIRRSPSLLKYRSPNPTLPCRSARQT